MDKSVNFQMLFTDPCPKLEENNVCATVQVASSFFSILWVSGTTIGLAIEICLPDSPILEKLQRYKFYISEGLYNLYMGACMVFVGQAKDVAEHGKTKYTLIKDVEDYTPGMYEKRLPCFGCGVGWFSFLLGFLFPPMWYYATFLYFGNYYRKDPRERAGLAASAITALGCSIVVLIVLLIRLFSFSSSTAM